MNNIKKIQVFGSGCPSCTKLFDQTKEAVSQLGLDVEVEYSSDIQKIIDMGMMTSPLLVVDGKVLMSGQLPGVEKIKKLIGQY